MFTSNVLFLSLSEWEALQKLLWETLKRASFPTLLFLQASNIYLPNTQNFGTQAFGIWALSFSHQGCKDVNGRCVNVEIQVNRIYW